ncbi:hypothetical protein DACRYDRAFT_23923 [Dacryopinax primogenitus]|uniref:Uncharacterized protein n=1 Tax=Dacryopinax primogenitus (strain DJM 731) TaxID=1858805 RepID=M5FQV8_DACPD|nr:uncharacterized protein DACRYDRAFT_23923 [Dacryopinax primogenitus]EJT99370.1 hypothetical protein DACRYDRAFT_23923 [Dacryopinax primogenitus]
MYVSPVLEPPLHPLTSQGITEQLSPQCNRVMLEGLAMDRRGVQWEPGGGRVIDSGISQQANNTPAQYASGVAAVPANFRTDPHPWLRESQEVSILEVLLEIDALLEMNDIREEATSSVLRADCDGSRDEQQ